MAVRNPGKIRRDSVLFLVDASLSRRGSSAVLRATLHAISITIREWLRKGDGRFDVSVVLCNAEVRAPIDQADASNGDPSESDSENTYVVMRFDRPDPNDLLRLVWLGAELEDCDEDAQPFLDSQVKCKPSQSGLQDGLRVSMSQFASLDPESPTYRRLVLVSPNLEPLDEYSEVSEIMTTLAQNDVLVIPLLLSVDACEEAGNDPAAPAEFWRILKRHHVLNRHNNEGESSNAGAVPDSQLADTSISKDESSDQSYSVSIRPLLLSTSEPNWRATLLEVVRAKAERKPALFRGELVVGKLRIGIAAYHVIENSAERSKGPPDILATENKLSDRVVEGTFDHQSDDQVNDVEDKRILLTPKQSEQLRNLTAQNTNIIVVEKFIEVWNVPELLSVRTPMFIVPSDFQIKRSRRAFASLHRSLQRSRRVAEVVFYRQSNPDTSRTLPIRGYLFAFAECADSKSSGESTGVLGPDSKCGMHFVPIPTLNDCRARPNVKTMGRDVRTILPEMRALLHKFWSPQGFEPSMFYNAVTYQFSRILEHMALKINSQPSILEPHDSTLPNYDFIGKHLPSREQLESTFFGMELPSNISPTSLFVSSLNAELSVPASYIPKTFEKSLNELSFDVPPENLELICVLLLGKKMWDDSIAALSLDKSVPRPISSWIRNFIAQRGLDEILQTLCVPQQIHRLTYLSMQNRGLSRFPTVYKKLVSLMYGHQPPVDSDKIDSLIKSIYHKDRKRQVIAESSNTDNETFNDVRTDQPATKKARRSLEPVTEPSHEREEAEDDTNLVELQSSKKDSQLPDPEHQPSASDDQPSSLGIPSITAESGLPAITSSTSTDFLSQIPSQASVIAQCESTNEAVSNPSHVWPKGTSSQVPMDSSSQVNSRLLSHNSDMIADVPSFIPSQLENFESQVSENPVVEPEEDSHDAVEQNAGSPNASMIRNFFSMVSRFVSRMEPEQLSSLESEASIENGSPARIVENSVAEDSLRNVSTQRKKDGPHQYTLPNAISTTDTSHLQGRSFPSSKSPKSTAGNPALFNERSSDEPAVAPLERTKASSTSRGPEYIPSEWFDALINQRWSALDIHDQLMIGELLGIDNRDVNGIQDRILVLLRAEINQRRRARIISNKGLVRPIHQKYLIKEFLEETNRPKMLHDHVKREFLRDHNDGISSVTGIMLKTVSRMYGLPSDGPMVDIVGRLRAVFFASSQDLFSRRSATDSIAAPLGGEHRVDGSEQGIHSSENSDNDTTSDHLTESTQQLGDRSSSNGRRLPAILDIKQEPQLQIQRQRRSQPQLHNQRNARHLSLPQRQAHLRQQMQPRQHSVPSQQSRLHQLSEPRSQTQRQPRVSSQPFQSTHTYEQSSTHEIAPAHQGSHPRLQSQPSFERNLSGAYYHGLSGLEKLRIAFTEEERKRIQTQALDQMDQGNISYLNATQLQLLCKRLKIRNEGTRAVLIERIETELDL